MNKIMFNRLLIGILSLFLAANISMSCMMLFSVYQFLPSIMENTDFLRTEWAIVIITISLPIVLVFINSVAIYQIYKNGKYEFLKYFLFAISPIVLLDGILAYEISPLFKLHILLDLINIKLSLGFNLFKFDYLIETFPENHGYQVGFNLLPIIAWKLINKYKSKLSKNEPIAIA